MIAPVLSVRAELQMLASRTAGAGTSVEGSNKRSLTGETRGPSQEKAISSTRPQWPRTYGEACFESTTSLARSATLHAATRGMNSALQKSKPTIMACVFFFWSPGAARTTRKAICFTTSFSNVSTAMQSIELSIRLGMGKPICVLLPGHLCRRLYRKEKSDLK